MAGSGTCVTTRVATGHRRLHVRRSDRNEHLPTVHGFDEFFDNLHHLNAEDEPEYTDYPKDPKHG